MEMMRRNDTLIFGDLIHHEGFVASRQQGNPDELTPQNEIIDDDSSFASFTL